MAGLVGLLTCFGGVAGPGTVVFGGVIGLTACDTTSAGAWGFIWAGGSGAGAGVVAAVVAVAAVVVAVVVVAVVAVVERMVVGEGGGGAGAGVVGAVAAAGGRARSAWWSAAARNAFSASVISASLS